MILVRTDHPYLRVGHHNDPDPQKPKLNRGIQSLNKMQEGIIKVAA
jgi:hypothetical protein